MPIDAGQLRERITIQRPLPGTPAEDNFGKAQASWVDYASRFAKVELGAATEGQQAGAKHASHAGTFTIRATQGVTEKMRIVWRSRIFNINGVVDPNDGDLVVITATEQA